MRYAGIPMLTFLVVANLFSAAGAGAGEPGTHLFILSGQSNMTGGLKAGFTRRVEEHYGKENVAVVMQMKSGCGIRFWVKDYKFLDNYRVPGKGVPSERSKRQHGELYGLLIETARNACKGKSYDTVKFVWMQGESDAGRGLGGVYEDSLLRLLGRLKTDLERKDIHFVIGRISGAGLTGPRGEQWRQVRDAQVKLAEKSDHGAWIDTDDLNGPGDDVHYPGMEAGVLGARFAAKAIELIRKRSARNAKDSQPSPPAGNGDRDKGESK